LKDTDLKAEVAGYYTDIEYNEQWKTNWREAQIAMEQTLPSLLDFDIREAGTRRYNGGPDWITREFRFDASDADRVLQRTISDPRAKGQIENMTRIQDTMFLVLTEIRNQALALEASL